MQFDHGVRVVGYGTDTGIHDWNVRNWWHGRMLQRKACVQEKVLAYAPVFIFTIPFTFFDQMLYLSLSILFV